MYLTSKIMLHEYVEQTAVILLTWSQLCGTVPCYSSSLNSAVVTVPSWDYFVLPLLLLSVFCSLHLPLISVLESSLLLHFHKHNQCSQDQSMKGRLIISPG